MANVTDPELRDLLEEEVAGGLDAIERLLSGAAETEALDALYGHAQMLRGSAAVMGLPPLSSAAAAFARLFRALREGSVPAADLAEPLGAAVREMRYLAAGLLGGLDVGGVAIDIQQGLDALRRSLADGAAPTDELGPPESRS